MLLGRGERRDDEPCPPLLFEGACAKSVASLSIPSWNQVAGFLESMRQLRDAPGFAA